MATNYSILYARDLRYYRIGIKITILLSKSIVSVSYQYRNSVLEKYHRITVSPFNILGIKLCISTIFTLKPSQNSLEK